MYSTASGTESSTARTVAPKAESKRIAWQFKYLVAIQFDSIDADKQFNSIHWIDADKPSELKCAVPRRDFWPKTHFLFSMVARINQTSTLNITNFRLLLFVVENR
jgi:hypothetical protein